MQDPELRRLWEELDRQRKDLDWILSVLSQYGTLHAVNKSPHQLLERVRNLEQDVAALKHLLFDHKEMQPGSDSSQRRTARRSRYGAALLAVRRPFQMLFRKHPRDLS